MEPESSFWASGRPSSRAKSCVFITPVLVPGPARAAQLGRRTDVSPLGTGIGVSVVGVTLNDIALTNLDGKPTTLAELSDGATLVVNVASKCGLTRHWRGWPKAIATAAWRSSASRATSSWARNPATGLKGSWFVSALAWNMGAFRRNPVALVLRNETNDVLA